jgi:aminoglycoside phosphotransferase (APT) family kinase protein
VLTRPDGLADDTIADALRQGWAFDATSLTYAPVGFGSHHWIAIDERGGRRFVTIDETAKIGFDVLERALRTVRALRDAGLAFAMAPMGDLVPIGDGFAMAVYPWLDGTTYEWSTPQTKAHRDGVLGLLAELHAATDVVRGIAGVEDFALDRRRHIEAALRELDQPWAGGPYAEPARDLLAAHATDVQDALAAYDALVAGAARDSFVITHGEPHVANAMLVDGRWVLIDWDTALIGPPERDLWHLGEGDPAMQELYRIRWRLDEIGIYVALFREPHTATADIVKSWDGFVGYVTGSL